MRVKEGGTTDSSWTTGVDNSNHRGNSYCFRGKLDCGGGRAEKAESREGGSGMSGMQLRQTESPTLLCRMKSMLQGGKSDRERLNQQMRLIERDFLFFTVNSRTEFELDLKSSELRSAGLVARPASAFAHKADGVNREQRG